MKIFQKGWNFSEDGPGNRLVYHMQGCNLRCPWCSNPEGLSPNGVLIVSAKHLLDSVCPYGAIKNSRLDRSKCAACVARDCITRKKTRGIRLSCFEMTPAEIVNEASAARHLFHSGGGVTFSGGEPTLQFADLFKTLALLEKRGINTAIETNGSHRRLPDLFSFIDCLIIDFKHYDNKLHRARLGAGNPTVLTNIAAAARSHPWVLVRITLIPGFNASPEDADQFVRLLAPFKGKNFAVEFLSYHEYGRIKWEQCGLEYTMKSAIIDHKAEEYFRSRFTESGLTVVNT